MSRLFAILGLLAITCAAPCFSAVIFSESFDSVPFVEKGWLYLDGYQAFDSQCVGVPGTEIYVNGWVYNNMSKGIPGSWNDYFSQMGWPLCESTSNVGERTDTGLCNIKCRDNPLMPLNEPLDIAQKNHYDWQMDPSQPGNGCFKTAIPQDWTIAFDWWGDTTAYGEGYQRGKMGVSKIANQYAFSGGSLHMWSSHGNLRVVSPALQAEPGAFRLKWKSSVWNLAGPSPDIQQLWTDWAQWGWGSNNWENPWNDLPYPPGTNFNDPTYAISVNHGWYWHKDPYHDSDPEGYMDDRPDLPRPAGEEAGVWREWERDFIVPLYSWYIGFNCGHAHDPWNAGYKWGTIFNIDDVTVEELPPYEHIGDIVDFPDGKVVAVSGKVATGTYYDVFSTTDVYNPDLLTIEEDDRSCGIEVQYDSWSAWVSRGDRVYVAGVLRQLPTGPRICPSDGYTVVRSLYTPGDVDPVWMSDKAIAGGQVPGLNTTAMLARIGGTVTKVNLGAKPNFVLDDGAGVPSPYADATGVTVICTGLPITLPVVGKQVVVTGVTGLQQDSVSGQVTRIIRPRDGADISVLD